MQAARTSGWRPEKCTIHGIFRIFSRSDALRVAAAAVLVMVGEKADQHPLWTDFGHLEQDSGAAMFAVGFIRYSWFGLGTGLEHTEV